ncbi:hypothetical protein G7046_g2764 [Stylonectria norvegica]|nr:hypothetical protein G7046_g2764 [Stylonectria norvegica]
MMQLHHYHHHHPAIYEDRILDCHPTSNDHAQFTSPPSIVPSCTSVVFPPISFPCTAIIGRRRRDRHKQGPRVPRWVARRMGQEESTVVGDSVPPHTLMARSLPAVADYIKSGQAKKIVLLTGAGISTAAGIPDFRSPKTGLYSNLARLNLPYAEAVFDISYFRQHPEPFYVLASELYPGKFHPTVSHAFIALLAHKGLLQMLFTQNIDCLERRAGVPSDRIIEAHGSFATQRCIECKTEFPEDKMKEYVFSAKVPHCAEKDCKGLVKPDIVFFGESLPKAFDNNAHQTGLADLVLIIGTSLSVYPFAGLPEMAAPGKPRVLFNMEKVGQLGQRADDVIQLGSCDDGIRKLADDLGWRDELEQLWRDIVGHKEADRQLASQKAGDVEVEDEVQKLTEEIKTTLNFDYSDDDVPVEKGHVARIGEVLEGAIVGPKLAAVGAAATDSVKENTTEAPTREAEQPNQPGQDESGATEALVVPPPARTEPKEKPMTAPAAEQPSENRNLPEVKPLEDVQGVERPSEVESKPNEAL